MSPHITVKLRAAQRACGDLASALMSVAPTAEARIAIARAADEWSAAMARGITAAGQHPLASLAPPHGLTEGEVEARRLG